MTNETLETIRRRRSVRAFLPLQVKGEEVEAVVAAGLSAPSGGGRAWHFTVVQNADLLCQINRAAKAYAASCGLPWLEQLGRDENFHCVYQAPTVIFVSAEEENVCAVPDTAAATENMLLAAESIGLGACWGYFATQCFLSTEGPALRTALQIPAGYAVYTSVMLGYKAEEATAVPEHGAPPVTYIT